MPIKIWNIPEILSCPFLVSLHILAPRKAHCFCVFPNRLLLPILETHIIGIIHMDSFVVLFLKFIHVIACISNVFLFISKRHLILWIYHGVMCFLIDRYLALINPL